MFQLAPGDAHLIFDGEWLADFVRWAPISFSKNSDRNRKTWMHLSVKTQINIIVSLCVIVLV